MAFTFSEYQKLSKRTAIYPKHSDDVVFSYLCLGLCGESGEIAEKVKKFIRDHGGVGGRAGEPWRLTKNEREALMLELGDVMWYIGQLSTELGVELSEVASANLKKLLSRKRRGKIHGSGDGR